MICWQLIKKAGRCRWISCEYFLLLISIFGLLFILCFCSQTLTSMRTTEQLLSWPSKTTRLYQTSTTCWFKRMTWMQLRVQEWLGVLSLSSEKMSKEDSETTIQFSKFETVFSILCGAQLRIRVPPSFSCWEFGSSPSVFLLHAKQNSACLIRSVMEIFLILSLHFLGFVLPTLCCFHPGQRCWKSPSPTSMTTRLSSVPSNTPTPWVR